MNRLHEINQGTSVEKIREILETSTIFDKMEISGITKKQVQEKIKDLYERQIPNRTVFPNMDEDELAEYWFKNWLHPALKHVVPPSPRDKRGCSERVLKNDQIQDMLRTYENSQHNYNYTLDDIKAWLEEK